MEVTEGMYGTKHYLNKHKETISTQLKTTQRSDNDISKMTTLTLVSVSVLQLLVGISLQSQGSCMMCVLHAFCH